jgi:uncharacterized protein (TIGR02118 family)
MIRVLVFIKKLSGMPREDFIRYYEDCHVPMVNALLPFYAGYKRNYLAEPMHPADARNEFDVITELVFKDQSAFDAWSAALARPEIVDRIRADERNFLQSSYTQMWVVESFE